MESEKEKVIVINYLPSVGLPSRELRTNGKAGYHVHAGETGAPVGYRVYADQLTVLVPAAHVASIDVIL